MMADKPRMKQFLWQHLEGQEYKEQLQWVDRKSLIFRVLWMHAGRATFDKEHHQRLFYKYRQYRGHRRSEDLKQCFGMALKKCPSVTQIKLSTEDDWRYYRFTRSVGRASSRRKRTTTKSLGNCLTHSAHCPACSMSTTANTTPYDCMPHSLPHSPPTDLDGCYSFPLTPHSIADSQDEQPLPDDLSDIDVAPLRQIHQCPPFMVTQDTYNSCPLGFPRST